jgi:NADH-quinone oxidoreductase subunit E
MAKSKNGTRQRERLLIDLAQAQRRDSGVSAAVMQALAGEMDVSLSDVYGVASFYSFLSIRPLGRHVIRICRSVPCFLKSADSLAAQLENELDVRPGETTADGRFSLELVNCIGACDAAPAMLINDDVHGDLTPAKVRRILKKYP